MRVAVLAAALVALMLPSGSSAADPPRVTLFGDSPATGIQYNESARAILAEGISLRLEVAPCRRVAQTSCPYEGVRPPTLVDIATLAGPVLGETVIVAVGYNDYENQYADDIQTALTTLRAVGVKRILWATLRAARNPYLTMNDAIREAAARNPDMIVVDWNLYSRSHPDWFQPDGIHLAGPGAEAMARLFHDALLKLDIPVEPPLAVAITTRTLPTARLGKRYGARLRAQGGTPPYRWALQGKRPQGLTLSIAGLLSWLPGAAGRYPLTVRAVDADGVVVKRPLRLSVRR